MLAVAKERNTPDCALTGPRGQWGPGREGKRKGLQGAGGEVTAYLAREGEGLKACLVELLMEVGH